MVWLIRVIFPVIFQRNTVPGLSCTVLYISLYCTFKCCAIRLYYSLYWPNCKFSDAVLNFEYAPLVVRGLESGVLKNNNWPLMQTSWVGSMMTRCDCSLLRITRPKWQNVNGFALWQWSGRKNKQDEPYKIFSNSKRLFPFIMFDY